MQTCNKTKNRRNRRFFNIQSADYSATFLGQVSAFGQSALGHSSVAWQHESVAWQAASAQQESTFWQHSTAG